MATKKKKFSVLRKNYKKRKELINLLMRVLKNTRNSSLTLIRRNFVLKGIIMLKS